MGPLTWLDTYKAHWGQYPRKMPHETMATYWARYDVWRAELIRIENAMPPGEGKRGLQVIRDVAVAYLEERS